MNFKNLFQKMRGSSAALPPAFSKKVVLLTWLGGFIAISSVTLLSEALSTVLILGSFGASCVILFGYPDSPFAQPRNTIGGHFLSSLIGLMVIGFFGATWWALALAVATVIAVMMMTNTVHPPAGSNPGIIWLMAVSNDALGWDFLFFPTLLGAIIITLIALVYNNIAHETNYPKYWF